MKVRSIQLHNFRSIKDLSVALDDYCLLVGENNTGKTALLSAVRDILRGRRGEVQPRDRLS